LTFDESKRRFRKIITRSSTATFITSSPRRKLSPSSAPRDRTLHEILHVHQGENIVIFSHTGAICFLTLYLLGAINRRTKTTPWLVTSNCGINRFEIRGRNNIRVHAINDTRHLFNANYGQRAGGAVYFGFSRFDSLDNEFSGGFVFLSAGCRLARQRLTGWSETFGISRWLLF
jgi:hypothetical protein